MLPFKVTIKNRYGQKRQVKVFALTAAQALRQCWDLTIDEAPVYAVRVGEWVH